MPIDRRCDVDEYLNDDLPVCFEHDSDSWEADFLQQLQQQEQVEEDENEEEMDIESLPPKLKNFKEAVQSLEDVQQFLESRGYTKEALEIGSTIDTMTALKVKSSKQTTVHDYFHSQ